MSENVWIAGVWRAAESPVGGFRAVDPTTGEEVGPVFPKSSPDDVEACLAAAAAAAVALAEIDPAQVAAFLGDYAARIDADAPSLAALAARETGLPVEPRLLRVEIPRTTGQLRQAAEAARSASFAHPVIDTKAGLRSCFGPLGKPVLVLGPANFPFAFNAVAGGDLAAALAARNPVIAKAHPGHPATTQALARHAGAALGAADLPPATVQLLYDVPPAIGLRLCRDARLGAIAFTGSRHGGLALKAAADAAAIPIYLEMSSVNPIFVLPGALDARGDTIAEELAGSCLLGAGQFCTNPGLVVLVDDNGPAAQRFVAEVARRFAEAPPAVLLGRGVRDGLEASVAELVRAGASIVAGGRRPGGAGFRAAPALLTVPGKRFLAAPAALSREAFGPASLIVLAADADALRAIAAALEGNLTAAIYSAEDGRDEDLYRAVARVLRGRAGRLLDDKMPTGVAVSPAMAHGGPYPATAHPGFTSVGIPAAIRRFTALHAYDHVRETHLPPVLRDRNPGDVWRCIDGRWTQEDVS
jgi:NADP-dependent aldehyde dehydrogenase